MNPFHKLFIASGTDKILTAIWGYIIDTTTGDETYKVEDGARVLIDITAAAPAGIGGQGGPILLRPDGGAVAITGELSMTLGGTTPGILLLGYAG